MRGSFDSWSSWLREVFADRPDRFSHSLAVAHRAALHARIELRNGAFYLADSSTNGTYVLEEGSPEHCVKRDEMTLAEKGHIGCGFSVADNMSDAVAFALD